MRRLSSVHRPVILVLAMMFGLSSWANLKTVQKSSQSRHALVELMADPAVAKAYRQMQYDLLNTQPDSDLRAYFENADGIATPFSQLGELQEQLISDFLKQAEIGMYRVNQNSPGKMGFLHEAFVQTALDLGFSKEAIANSRIYITYGNVNAFTISGSDNAIVVVVQSELLEKLSQTEVNSVLAHELGHIRSKHTSMSIVASLLLNVGHAFLTRGPEALVQIRMRSADLVAEIKSDPRLYCSFSRQGGSAHAHQHSLAEHVFSMGQSDKLMNQIVSSVLGLPPAVLIGATYDFLRSVRQNAQTLELPAETIDYLDQTLTVFKDNMSQLRLNSDVFKVHANVIMNALSRQKEKSADHYAGAILPNEIVASAFGKLMGANFSPKDRARLFKDIQAQVKQFNDSHSYEERAMVVAGSHPPLAIRVSDILSIEKYPNVAIAHPFLRFFMIRDQIWSMEKKAQATIKLGETALAELPKNEQLSEEEKVEVKTQIEEIVLLAMQQQEEMAAALPVAEDRIFELITSLGFAKRNPRAENMIQLLSYQKEIIYYQLEQLTKLQADEADEADEAAKRAYAAEIKKLNGWLQRPTPIVDRVLEVIQKVLDEGRLSDSPEALEHITKYKGLLLELKAVDGMAAGEKLRTKITNFDKRTSLPKSADPSRCDVLLIEAV